MLLLSPALIWHWLPGEGGPEAAAAARPRPPGIFERCSWVPGGWQTWQRRVGRTPEPTTRRGRGGRGWPLSGWPEDDGGAGPAQARPRRQPSPWPGGASGRPRPAPGIEAALFPCRARRGAGGGRQHPACSPGVRPRAPAPTAPWAPASERARSNGCPERLCRQGSGTASCPSGHLTLSHTSSLSLSFPIHRKNGDNGPYHSGLPDDRMKNAHRGLSTRPGALLALRGRSPWPEELQSSRAATRAPASRVQARHHTLSDHHRLFRSTKANPGHHTGQRRSVPVLWPSDPVSGPEGFNVALLFGDLSDVAVLR
uniref:Uncharacterized protein n=1 Tax=Ailuropoda melanoleuca TaxID=9646 RepID=A0A7N5JLP6_AILME